jgi:hypothetical protein
MSVNRQVRHVFVLPEDDANRQLANGFLLDPFLLPRRIQILEEAGGWRKVIHCFRSEHVWEMERNANRFMVLLIDFDGKEERLKTVRAAIPDHLKERVFVLGTWSEPEKLRTDLGSYESIGLALAKECRENTEVTWAHGLLRHNVGELERLKRQVRPILFPDDRIGS